MTQIVLGITGLDMQTVINDPYMRVFFFIPVAGVMLLTIILFKKYDIAFARITRLQSFKEDYQIDPGSAINVFNKEYLPAVIFIFLPVFLLFLFNFSYIGSNME